ncbi:Galactoside 2-alpha-L-fucosyltransferase 1 [Bulinus truncatus]|nr:Galactoside 2-alpha-L-fucosyltransferase 1 [Bulinus truncatus]
MQQTVALPDSRSPPPVNTVTLPGSRSPPPATTVNMSGDITIQSATPMLYLTSNFMGRLGNQMFIYATLLGLARAHNRRAFVKDGGDLVNTFQISFLNKNINTDSWMIFKEKTYSTFDPLFMILPEVNLTLYGGLQTWRYFMHAKDEIRREFTLRSTLHKYAQNVITNCRRQLDNHVLVGVHVRRGDILTPHQVKFGYQAADASYFRKAFIKMRSFLPNQNITFLVASEDLDWCVKNLNDSSVSVLPPGSAAEHIAVLSSCDHVIITGGTYGWMAAWLANGITIYNTKHVSRTAPVRNGFTDGDFYLPGWIGLD